MRGPSKSGFHWPLMKHGMRFATTVVFVSVLSVTCAHAQASDPVDPAALAALEAKAGHAGPRERCFLYSQLVSRMTDLAGQQLDSDDPDQASETLKRVQQYAEKIRTGVADDSKKLIDAEQLTQRAAARLTSMLGGASYEDRPAWEATLKQVNQVHAQILMQVFKR
jgi:hypothetical protein